ncbi:hypothetical protein Landi51_13773 [Colletotrichum acutatum]
MRNWYKLWDLDSGRPGRGDEMPSPLYYASLVGARFLVERLYKDWETPCNLEESTNQSSPSREQERGSHGEPIQAAVALGRRDVVEFFLDKEVDPNMMVWQTYTAYGTPLMTASAHGQTEIIELLLERGAEVNAIWSMPRLHLGRWRFSCNVGFPTALVAASFLIQKEAVELLLKHGAVDDVHSGFSFFHKSALRATMDPECKLLEKKKRAATISILLQEFDGAKVTTSPKIFELYMDVAVETGNIDLALKYLDKWILCGKPGFSPGETLQLASVGGHQRIAHQLLQSGARVADSGRVRQTSSLRDAIGPALEEASGNGHPETVKLLLSYGTDLSFPLRGEDFRFALWRAVAEGHEEIVRLLLNIGADPNSSDETQMPALYAAIIVGTCNRGNIGIVEILMARGASFLARNSVATKIRADTMGFANRHWDLWDQIVLDVSKYRPLYSLSFVKEGKSKRLKALLRREIVGIELKVLDPLSAASFGGHVDIVQRCLGILTEENAENRVPRLRAALSAAAAGNHLEVVESILDFDRKIHLRELDWRRARYLASLMGNQDVVQVLVGRSESLILDEDLGIGLLFERKRNS